jgi:hypothetical protein
LSQKGKSGNEIARLFVTDSVIEIHRLAPLLPQSVLERFRVKLLDYWTKES